MTVMSCCSWATEVRKLRKDRLDVLARIETFWTQGVNYRVRRSAMVYIED